MGRSQTLQKSNVNFARRIQHLMSQQHQEVYHKTLVMFSSKLEIVTSMLTTLVNPDGSHRAKLKYVWKKESLDEAIEGLEVWQKTTDHSWFLLMRMRIADPGVDSALSIGDSGALISTTSTSAIRAGLRTAKPTTPPSGLTLDYRELETMTVDGIAFSEAKMAKRTQQSGVISSIPPSLGDPRSLRDLFLNTESPKSLTQRFDIAKDLAKSVGYVHTFGFVHKNIRPESVLSLGTTDGPLGVCLLEVGLWKSFIEYPVIDGETTPQWSPVLGMPTILNLLQAAQYLYSEAKQRPVFLAQDELPYHMGTKYTDIVVNCLTCLNPDNQDFGDEKKFQDKDEIGVGARYIEKGGLRLEYCMFEDVH
ncbi:hypothetical protein VM1G_08762 [Cytospora mali]|uniref:Protein kinase domain-containing protein n=1 Tax=Cytospora mali TaxID=578113 RepID=A0A194WBS3_CYTMA|nr:hypothetical protein VM1G_08762 [Valsa mali]